MTLVDLVRSTAITQQFQVILTCTKIPGWSSYRRSVFGRTLSQISEKCNSTLKNLTACGVKKMMRYYQNTLEEMWRTGIAREIIVDNLDDPWFTDKELEEILHYICVSEKMMNPDIFHPLKTRIL